MPLLALPRPAFRQGCLLSQLSQGSCISCFHTSASVQAKGKKSAIERKRTRSIPDDDDPAAAWNSRPLGAVACQNDAYMRIDVKYDVRH
ncbi:uncharacterized protein LAESUDRAFT_564823 [Laetiporus sulphureus 93-53]|uniref:Uncharacterized protein n=1 Tax=Laetiporus sulphureus 93-53 TaxID=1314785 RepID=A0A165FEY6_9APHY|nr:uncharacterized protein LAESUDRAFT_564823 [Laetiporus sulphureus 93-53]KZT08868.1 hypothetical protein LAESUDRAFT_564823 [Laetiporus sulphureus 93-53]